MELILLLLSIADKAIDAVQKQRIIEKQAGRLTPEQDAELDAQLERLFQGRQWKTDDQIEKSE